MKLEDVEKLTIKNSLQLTKLAGVVDQSSKNVNKLIEYMEEEKAKNINNTVKTHAHKLTKLKPILTMLEYKNATLLMCIGLYATAFTEFRNIVVVLIKALS